MKKLLLFVCVIALVHGLCGCGDQTPQGTENNTEITDDSGNQTQSDPNNAGTDEEKLNPADVKDGDILSNGSVYLTAVAVDCAEDAKQLLENYAGEKTEIRFTTPEYTGIVTRTADSYIVSKMSDAFVEDVIYMDIGIINTYRCEYDNGKIVLEHTASTEADYYVDTYYNGNVERHEFIGLDGTVREVEEYDKGEGYSVLTYVKYDGGEQWFTYADKANKVLATMRVAEDNGMDYTFTLDGAGHNPENVLSMTLTQNGTTTTYDQGSIPWYSVASPPGRMPRG